MPTPPESGPGAGRPVIEPTYVMRRRRTEALAELLREFDRDRAAAGAEEFETVAVPPPRVGAASRPEELEEPDEPPTEELPPVIAGEDYSAGQDAPPAPPPERPAAPRRARPAPPGRALGTTRRRAAAALALAAAALIGFGGAGLFAGGEDAGKGEAAAPAAPAPRPSAEVPTRQAADPDGPGTLREGDTGPEVTELQQRLRRVPNVYDDGPTSGTYDAVLTEAVARFQLWYGIRGDETGVYGNDTRRDLESRTAL